MEAVAEKLYTLEEYFDFCKTHEGRFEFVNGEIIEMSGESVTANRIAGNIHIYLRNFLEDEPYIFVQNSVKLQVKEDRIFRIPDFLIFNEKGDQNKFATEPILIAEVLSGSTARVDRTTKLNEYCMLPTLQYYLIVAQENCFVEAYIREGERWYVEFYDEMDDEIALPFLRTQITLREIYKKITFQPAK